MNKMYGKCWPDILVMYVEYDIQRMLLVDMEFLLLYSTQDLTCLLRDILS